MTTGTVKWFNTTEGFGFIQPDNGSTDVDFLPSYPNAAPVAVTMISFVFVIFLIGEGRLW